MNKDSDHIPDRQRRIIQRVASGEAWRVAAKAEGYSDSYARVARTRMMKKASMRSALESIHKKGCEMAAYDLVTAMKEADNAAAFAKLHKNAMANVKACELRAKLSGLLIERVEVVTVVLSGALEAAHTRVFPSHNNGPAQTALKNEGKEPSPAPPPAPPSTTEHNGRDPSWE